MASRTLYFFLREVYANFKNNPLMTFASITTIAILITILGIFLLITMNLNKIQKDFLSQLQISAYLKDELTPRQINTLKLKIISIPQVKEVIYKTKEEALQDLQNSLKGEIELSGLLKNPLPPTFIIKAEDPYTIPQIAKEIEKLKGVKEVNYWQKYTQKLLTISNTLNLAGAIIVGFLLFSSLLIINNTIRLAIFSHRREIHIMQLVGAANWFVRLPFIIEGIFYGLLGSIIAVILLNYSYNALIPHIKNTLPFLEFISHQQVLTNLFLFLVLIGVSIGALGSYFSVNRFLKL